MILVLILMQICVGCNLEIYQDLHEILLRDYTISSTLRNNYSKTYVLHPNDFTKMIDFKIGETTP